MTSKKIYSEAERKYPGYVRIIGGQWRGRKIAIPPVLKLRPTPDRVRETLFNWLMPVIAGARCLDLFAGSGALGLEALSRGAHFVSFIDNDRKVIDHLHYYLRELGANNATVQQADSRFSLPKNEPFQPFDIVFLDPPFHQNEIVPCLEWLKQPGWLAPNALIYIEVEADWPGWSMLQEWQVVRSQRAGQVSYSLIRRLG